MKWYEKGWVIFLLLLFVFPVGVFLLWKCGHWHKLIKVIATVVFGFVFLMVITPTPDEVDIDISTEANVQENIDESQIDEPDEPVETPKTEPVEVSEPEVEPESISEPEISEVEPEPTPEVEHRTGDDFIGISDKDISETNIDSTAKRVNNDVTGNFRYNTLTGNINLEEYALSYYQKYFQSDNEIHFIINPTKYTTTAIEKAFESNYIFVTMRYSIAHEEEDAKVLGSGEIRAQYRIYIDNGDIEKIQ